MQYVVVMACPQTMTFVLCIWPMTCYTPKWGRCLAQGHNTWAWQGIKSATFKARVSHPPTAPSPSAKQIFTKLGWKKTGDWPVKAKMNTEMEMTQDTRLLLSLNSSMRSWRKMPRVLMTPYVLTSTKKKARATAQPQPPSGTSGYTLEPKQRGTPGLLMATVPETDIPEIQEGSRTTKNLWIHWLRIIILVWTNWVDTPEFF